MNEPLTLEQLKDMDGKAAYWKEDNSWGIIVCEKTGRWTNIPFFRGRKQGVNFEYDIESRGMEIYAYLPTRIDREAWEPCEYCTGKINLYQHTHTTKLFMNTFEEAATLVTECMACPPYADCCMNGISANSAFKINFCPNCGATLTDEAVDMVMERLEALYGQENT